MSFANNPSHLSNKTSGDWQLLSGHIYDSTSDKYLIGVQFDHGGRYPHVHLSSPLFNPTDGSGMYHKPLVNTRVLVAVHADGQMYIIGFLPSPIQQDLSTPEVDYTNGRRALSQGDFVLGTSSGNYIKIMNAGEGIQIKNGPGNEISMSSVGNTLRIICQRFVLKSDACTIEQFSDEYGNACSSFLFQNDIEDDSQFVKLDIGSIRDKELDPTSAEAGVAQGDPEFIPEEHTDFPDTPAVILSLNICNKLRITADVEGNIKIQGNKAAKAIFKDFIYTESLEGDISTVADKGNIMDTADEGNLTRTSTLGEIVDSAKQTIDHRKVT